MSDAERLRMARSLEKWVPPIPARVDSASAKGDAVPLSDAQWSLGALHGTPAAPEETGSGASSSAESAASGELPAYATGPPLELALPPAPVAQALEGGLAAGAGAEPPGRSLGPSGNPAEEQRREHGWEAATPTVGGTMPPLPQPTSEALAVAEAAEFSSAASDLVRARGAPEQVSATAAAFQRASASAIAGLAAEAEADIDAGWLDETGAGGSADLEAATASLVGCGMASWMQLATE